MNVTIRPGFCQGTLKAVPSKSMGHRAMICAALANGVSRIENMGASRDMEATRSCLEALGARFSNENDTLVVEGIHPENLDHPALLNPYESGSTLRFMIPIAALSHQTITFEGQPSLLSRPMGIYADIFLEQNLVFDQSPEKIVIHGPLQNGIFSFPGSVSSQFVSGLLFAAPLMKGLSEIALIPPVESLSYIDMTLQMQKAFGIDIEKLSASGYRIKPQPYQSADVCIEGDYSQIAFFAVWAALSHSLTITHLNPDSLQGDKVILDMIEKAGARIIWKENKVIIEPKAHIPCVFDLADCPDLGPILCVLAAYLPGTSRLINAGRLRIKESDRIAAMEAELKKWNVDIVSDENSITIQGKTSYKMDQPVIIEGHNDHRIVMAMAVFGALAQSDSIIEGAQAINKSYPDFFRDFNALLNKGEKV